MLPVDLDAPVVPVTYAAHWVALLEGRGVAAATVLEGTGLTPSFVDGPGRLSLAVVLRMLANGLASTDDPSLGLELGLGLMPTSHGTLGVALISCDTLGDAIRLGERYMLQRAMPWGIRLVVEGDVAVMQFVESVPLGPMRAFVLEIVLGGIVRLGEHMLGISFAHPAIEFWADFPEQPHHARFHPRMPVVHYDRPQLCARFPAAWLERRLAWREPVARREAIAVLESERRLLPLGDEGDVVARTRALLADPQRGYPDLDAAAAALRVSSRTLRRQLQRAAVSFHELRDEARRARAVSLLTQTSLGIDAIATELGYAETAGFTRAFVRWTGATPTAYRRSTR